MTDKTGDTQSRKKEQRGVKNGFTERSKREGRQGDSWVCSMSEMQFQKSVYLATRLINHFSLMYKHLSRYVAISDLKFIKRNRTVTGMRDGI